MKKLELADDKEFKVNEFKDQLLNSYWDRWIIFRPNRIKEWHMELKKLLPPYFDSTTNKINDFSMRENVLFPPCPQEFLEVLLNGILLRNELGLYRSRYYFFKELQQLLIEYLKLFYYRIDAIIDIFQTITKQSISKEKYPKIVVKCSNCNFYVFITVYCSSCQNEFYCDETCKKIHLEEHRQNCDRSFNSLPKILEPLRIEVHISSNSLGEEILIFNEHHMKFSKMMKGKILLAFLYKTLRKDRWFRNNRYIVEENVQEHYIAISRGINVDLDVVNYDNKDFIHKMTVRQIDAYFEDDFRDLLRFSVIQELKFNFYKLGALLVDIFKEQHPGMFKYILVFNFP